LSALVQARLAAFERHGSIYGAARELGVCHSTLRAFLVRRGWAPPVGRSFGQGRPLVVKVRSTPYGLEKLCRGPCAEWLPLDECFAKSRSGAFGRENICRACRNEDRARKRRQNPGYSR
jgi:hypothetical protein